VVRSEGDERTDEGFKSLPKCLPTGLWFPAYMPEVKVAIFQTPEIHTALLLCIPYLPCLKNHENFKSFPSKAISFHSLSAHITRSNTRIPSSAASQPCFGELQPVQVRLPSDGQGSADFILLGV
jgi:hypothetical protein